MTIRAVRRSGWRVADCGAAGRLLLASGAGLLGLLPLANIIRIVATTGANTPSSDDDIFILRFVGPILDGTYRWRHFFRDGFHNTHADYFPGLLYILAAKLTDLNIYAILYAGIALAAVRALLLYTLLARGRGFSTRALLWPIVAALTFSTAQISIFEHPFSSATINLSLLGLTLGLCGLGWFPDRRRGLALLLGGGVLAAWSFGSGLLAWPVFLLGLWLRGVRRRWPYLALLGGGLLTGLPYAIFLLRDAGSADTAAPAAWRILLAPIVLLGFPLAQDFSRPVAGAVGLLGVAGAGAALLLLRRRGKQPLEPATVTGLLLVAFGALAAAQLGLFRGRTAPWYTYVGMTFWLGLADVILGAVRPPARARLGGRALPAALLWRGAMLGGLALLYLTSNLTYTDKSFFLTTRSPAAAACVRAYRTAPAICDQLLRAYPGNWPRDYLTNLATGLERHQLAVFAPRQEWALQGDFGLGNVRDTTGGAYWSPDQSATPAPWTEYRHLNLALRPAGAVGWTITLPPDARSATLHTALATDHTPGAANAPDGIAFAITIEGADGTGRPLLRRTVATNARDWQPVTIPLEEFAGQRVTLQLATEGCAAPACLGFYRYPTIVLDSAR